MKKNKTNIGITRSGDKAQEVFCTATGGKSLAHSDPRGDVLMKDRDRDFFVEIKKLNQNQVRPNKYNVLAAFDEENDTWYIVPPSVVMEKCLNRRGQHVPDPLQCVSFGNVRTNRWFQEYKLKDNSNLRSEIIRAYRAGQRSGKMRELAKQHKEEQESTRASWQERLGRIVTP